MQGLPDSPRYFLSGKSGDEGNCSGCFWFPIALPSILQTKIVRTLKTSLGMVATREAIFELLKTVRFSVFAVFCV